MLNQTAPESFWNRADTSKVGRVMAVGLAFGIMGHWLYLNAPPLPVMAAGPTISATTNAPTIIKIEGASRSVRD